MKKGVPHADHAIKGPCDQGAIGASHSGSAPCLVMCTWAFCKQRYDLPNLLSELSNPPN